MIKGFLLLSASAATLLCTPVAAQVVSTDANNQLGENAEAGVEDGEILVTATRESSLISKTPIAITAVTGEGLIQAGVTNPTQLADVAPSLSIDRNNGLQITIRGVTSTDNTEKGDPSAGFVVDGVFLARAQAQEVSFFDLERVEVLRGPQGTLYGRNTTAGLISLISAKPKLGSFSGSFDGAYSNFGSVQATGVLNVPLGDIAAIRAAVNYDRRDSFILPGVSTFDIDPAKDNLSTRLTLLLEPSDRLSVTIRGDYSAIKGRPGSPVLLSNFYNLPINVPADGQLGVDPLVRSASNIVRRTLGYPERQQSNRDNTTWGIQGELAYELSDALTLNYNGSYRKFTRDEEFTGVSGQLRANGVIVTSPQTFDGTYDQISQELRLAYAGSGMKFQAGAYYFRETSDISFLLFGTQGFQPGQRGFIFGFPQSTVSKSLGLFGQGTFDLTDKLRLTAGVRWTKDNKNRVGATIFHANLTDPLDFTTATQPGTTNARGVRDSLNNATVKYSKVTWRAGLEYDLNPSTLLYGTASTGYKAGGFNDGCLAGDANCFGSAITTPDILFYKPETLSSYEVGFKTKLAGNALRLNGSLFHYDYSNLQLSQLTLIAGAPVQRTLNAGKAKVDGVELEAVVKPAPNHQFDIGVAWLNARYTDYLIDSAGPLTAQYAGKKLDRSPPVTVSAGYTWNVSLANGAHIDLNARTRLSAAYIITSPAIRAQFRQPSFTRTDLSVTYRSADDGWYIQGYVKNLENNLTLASATVVANFGAAFDNGTAQFTDPRLYGIRAGIKF